MKVSTRNQFTGTVSDINKGAVNSEVIIKISDMTDITSVITNGAIEKLGLKNGDKVTALVKASNVIIGLDTKNISARNVLCGKVSNIIEGPVNCEIDVDINKVIVTSIITKKSCDNLGLKKGKDVCAVFKASSVILLVE